MRKIAIMALLLLLIWPVAAKQNVGFGFSLARDSTGILFLVPSKMNINPEIVTSGFLSDDYYNLMLGSRLLYDLGKKDIVERYTGAGVGFNLSSLYNPSTNKMDNATTYWSQIFIGTKVAWKSKFLAAPIKFRSEVGLSASFFQDRNTAGTYLGVGIEYEF